MSAQMRAAIFDRQRRIRVLDVPRPEPGEGEVQIRVAAAGVCGSDLQLLHQFEKWRTPAESPYRAGHEIAGTIAAVGEGVLGWQIDQRVAVEPYHLLGCGRCYPCRRGEYQLCTERRHRGPRRRSAGFAEFDVIAATNLFPVPDHVPFAEAALGDVYACALHALRRCPVDAASTVVILGSGPIAISLGQLARTHGARRTILIGRGAAVLERAREAGAADLLIDALETPDLIATSGDLLGDGAEVVFEAVGGTGESLAQAISLAAPFGRICVVGCFHGDAALPARLAASRELTLIWSNSYSTSQGVREFQLALELIASGRVDAEAMVTHRLPLSDIARGFDIARKRRQTGAIKVILEPGR